MATNITIDIDNYDVWNAVDDYVEDMINDKLDGYVHDDDVECSIASYIDDSDLVTADMITDVTQFENRVHKAEEAINKLCDRSIEKMTKINEICAQILTNDQAVNQRIAVMQEQIDYLYNRVNDLEERTLRGRWDAMTTWIKEKFNA